MITNNNNFFSLKVRCLKCKYEIKLNNNIFKFCLKNIYNFKEIPHKFFECLKCKSIEFEEVE